MPFSDQRVHAVRFEWGPQGLEAVASQGVSAYIVVDVLSFTTAVSVAVERGAEILPLPWRKGDEAAYAQRRDALLAKARGNPEGDYSLSPVSLLRIAKGTSLVLPSPNGSTVAVEAARHGRVLAGCLRNRSAIVRYDELQQGAVVVIAAGERWPDGSLRPCFEDMLGAGAIIAQLKGSLSPEAAAAAAIFRDAQSRLGEALHGCSSGRELDERGFSRDVDIAAELDSSDCVPILKVDRFVRA